MPGPPPLPEESVGRKRWIFSVSVILGYCVLLYLFRGGGFDSSLGTNPMFGAMVSLPVCLTVGALMAGLVLVKDWLVAPRSAFVINIVLLISIGVIYFCWVILLMFPMWLGTVESHHHKSSAAAHRKHR